MSRPLASCAFLSVSSQATRSSRTRPSPTTSGAHLLFLVPIIQPGTPTPTSPVRFCSRPGVRFWGARSLPQPANPNQRHRRDDQPLACAAPPPSHLFGCANTTARPGRPTRTSGRPTRAPTRSPTSGAPAPSLRPLRLLLRPPPAPAPAPSLRRRPAACCGILSSLGGGMFSGRAVE